MAFKQLIPTHRSSMALFLLLITLLVVPFVSLSASALIPLHGALPSLAFTLWDSLLAIFTSSPFYFFLLNFLIVSLIVLSGVLDPLAPAGHSIQDGGLHHQGLHNYSMDAQRIHERLALDDELYPSQASSLPYLDVLERSSHVYVADDGIMVSNGFLDDGEAHTGKGKEVMGDHAPAAYVMRKPEFSETDCVDAAGGSSKTDTIVEAVPSAGISVDLDVKQRRQLHDGEMADLLTSRGHMHMHDESLQAGVGVDLQVIAGMDADNGKKGKIGNAGDRSLQSGSNLVCTDASEVADDANAEVPWLQQQELTKNTGNGNGEDDERLQYWPGRDGTVEDEDGISNGIKEEEEGKEEEEEERDVHDGSVQNEEDHRQSTQGEATGGYGKLRQRQSGAQSSNAGGINSPGREGDLCAGMGRRIERAGAGWEEDMAAASVAAEGMAMAEAEGMAMSRDELNERASAFISAFRRKLFHTASDEMSGHM